MDLRGWWWLWSQCPGLGVVRMRELQSVAIKQKLTLAELWTCSAEHLQQVLPWPESLLRKLQVYRGLMGGSPHVKVPVQALLPIDPQWPDVLNQLSRPPMQLFWKGNAALWPLLAARQGVAVVGTRAASPHGLRMAEEVGKVLAMGGWPVLSGLAEGIDAAAHRACLKEKGSPVAILGTPLNRVYPAQHADLQLELQAAGLLISEQIGDANVKRGYFAARNRLLVAMAQAVVVVECPKCSGALITARIAQDLGCPVWVVPGDAMRSTAKGSNALLLQSAMPLLNPEDLVNSIGLGPLNLRKEKTSSLRIPFGQNQWANSQSFCDLIDALGDGASLSDLMLRLNCSSKELSARLLQLELMGLVVAEQGMRWRLH